MGPRGFIAWCIGDLARSVLPLVAAEAADGCAEQDEIAVMFGEVGGR
jgi:hypothetical protein